MDKRSRALWIAATAALVAVAVLVRVTINFSSRYPPGVDAAYYPLQTRAWLTQGRLMYDDLPLIFWLNAGLSKLLTAAGRPLDAATLMASRLLDSILEPFAAIAIMTLGYVWSGGRLRALAGCLAAGSLVVLSPPVIRMLSDFEKNSLGLVFIACAIWACRNAMHDRKTRSWVLLVTIVSLAAVTHVGAFAVTMLTIGVALSTWALLSLPPSKRWQSVIAAVAGACSLAGMLAIFDARRALNLLRAPAAFFKAGQLESPAIPVLFVGAAVIAIAAWLAWRDRDELGLADVALVAALAMTLVVLAAPKSYVYFNRLQLMAPVPGAALLTFVVARGRRIGAWAGVPLLLIAGYAAVNAPETVQRPLMDQEMADELSAVRGRIPDPESTLVIAPHGLEWWAGHLLGTRVRSSLPHDAAKYRRVMLLRHTVDCRSSAMSPFAPPSVDETARKIYAGRCIELFQSE